MNPYLDPCFSPSVLDSDYESSLSSSTSDSDSSSSSSSRYPTKPRRRHHPLSLPPTPCPSGTKVSTTLFGDLMPLPCPHTIDLLHLTEADLRKHGVDPGLVEKFRQACLSRRNYANRIVGAREAHEERERMKEVKEEVFYGLVTIHYMGTWRLAVEYMKE